MFAAALTPPRRDWEAEAAAVAAPMPFRPADDLDERELVLGFRATGREELFDRLYRTARRGVFAVCLSYLKDIGRAEEACQEAFVRAYERFDSFETEAFGAWVRSIAARLCLNQIRHIEVRRRLDPELPPPSSTDAERGAAARQELAMALEIVARLPDEQRRVFVLRHLDQLSYQEIAERTGLPAGQVRSSLQNARRSFRRAWSSRTEPGGRGDE